MWMVGSVEEPLVQIVFKVMREEEMEMMSIRPPIDISIK